MGWVRLDDKITEHPKIAAAGPLGFALFVAGLAYCNRNLTDGFIPRSVAATLLSDEWTDTNGEVWQAAMTSGIVGRDFDCLALADHLVDVGLFHKVKRHGVSHNAGYAIHDYEKYQPSRAEVLERREKDLERQRKWRQSRLNTRKTGSRRHAVTNAVTNAVVTSDPTPSNTREAKASLGRARHAVTDELWDALVAEIGDVKTKDERGARNKAVKQLREVGATAEDIRRRCAQYRRTWPQLTLTATALVKHWTRMAPSEARKVKPIEEVLALPEADPTENAKRARAAAAAIGKNVS